MSTLAVGAANPVFQQPSLETQLLHAIDENNIASVRALLAAGANHNTPDKMGITPLMGATVRGH